MASLYLHIPFCSRKCIYCDFYSVTDLDRVDFYLDSLKREILMYNKYARLEPLETIYIGGGTPSLISSRGIGDIIDLIDKNYRIMPPSEITIEVNPGTADRCKLREYKNAGVNRLSIGVQSFNKGDLNFLGRIHSADDARQIISDANEAGFDNISIDLIFSLPGQSAETWLDNLRQACNLNIQHISTYSLIVEEGTPLACLMRGNQIAALSEEADAKFYELTMEFLVAHGFYQYEVSNFAKNGFQCKHNKNYWSHANYLGFGPSAHSFWLDRRWWNVTDLTEYCRLVSDGQTPVGGHEILNSHQLLEESIILGLRSGGIDLNQIHQRYNLNILSGEYGFIKQLLSEGFAVLEGPSLRLTRKGTIICDTISAMFLNSVKA